MLLTVKERVTVLLEKKILGLKFVVLKALIVGYLTANLG